MKVAGIDCHANGLPRVLDETGLRRIISELLEAGGRVAFRRHALERMAQREVSSTQVFQVLARGELMSGPSWDSNHESWTFSMRAHTAGEDVSVVASLCVERLMGQTIFAITVTV